MTRAEAAGLDVRPHLLSAARPADVMLKMAANLAGSVGLSVSRAALVDVLILH